MSACDWLNSYRCCGWSKHDDCPLPLYAACSSEVCGIRQRISNENCCHSMLWLAKTARLPVFTAEPFGSLECQVYYERPHPPYLLGFRLEKYLCIRPVDSSVQFSSVPWPTESSVGHDGRFSRVPLPVFFEGGQHEQFWLRQGRPLFDVVHPAFPPPTTAPPTFQGALKDGFGDTVVACHMPETFELPSL